MVAFSDLGKAQQLYGEAQNIDGALGNFDAGGAIITMTVSGGTAGGQPAFPRMPIAVDTTGMQYPAAMVDAIKAALTARRSAIDRELQELGVSGVDEARAVLAQPAPSQASRR